MKNQKGFSLIELLIVVVIIGIIAAIAIPNLLAARRSANEGSAISTLRTTHGAQMTYQATTGAGKYAADYPALYGAGLVDQVLGSTGATAGVKSGYQFKTTAADPSGGNPAIFAATGQPTTTSGVTQTGTRNFGIATEGVLYFDSTFGMANTAGAITGSNSAVLSN